MRAIPPIVLVGLTVAALRVDAAAAANAAPYDFDGDGRQSLTAGLPLSGTANAGAIVTWEDGAPRRLVQGSRDMPGTSESGDWFGWAVTSADFDGDGFADLAVGAPGEQPGGSRRRYGAVTVLPGSADGLTTAGARQILGPRPSEPGSTSDFGQALAAADFDRDGFDDLAVGAPGAATHEETSGAVELLFGGPDGLTTARRQVIARPHPLDGDFGAILATGDLDGDGHTDLIESGSFFRAHQYWCRGSGTGPTGCRALRWNADTGPSHMAAGDVTGDGYQDLVNGIEVWRDLPGQPGDPHPVGAIEVWPGGPAGPRRSIVITQNGPGVPGSDRPDETSDSFGIVFTLGNFDGDRFADIAIAAPTRIGRRSVGALVVMHGARSGYRRGGEVYTSRRLRVPKAHRRLSPISLALLDGDGDRTPELTMYAAGVEDRGVLVSVPAGRSGLAVRRARTLMIPHTTDGEFPQFGPFPFLSIRLLSLVASDLSGGHEALSSPL